MTKPFHRLLATVALLAIPASLVAQGTVQDYARAAGLRDKYTGKALNVAEAPRWIEQTSRFYYRRSVKGGNEWILVDGTTQEKKPAFDHARLADAIAKATARKATAVELPFTTFTFVENERSIEFTLGGGPGGARGGGPAARATHPPWRCSLESYTCRRRPRTAAAAAADAAAAAGWRGRCGRRLRSTASNRESRPTRSSRRSSTTTTSRSARSAAAS